MIEVAEAHLLMKDVAKNIDQVKRNLEQQSRVKELSGILDGWLGPGKAIHFPVYSNLANVKQIFSQN